MNNEEDAFSVNEQEVMEYYGLGGSSGRLKLKIKMLYSWILHSIAYSSPLSNFVIKVQRTRGVTIGKNCHISPYVLIDLVYPKLVKIEDNVTLGSNSMIFAHINPTANLILKKTHYPRKIAEVTIKSGAVINPGAIITAGVTIGKNSIVSIGSAVFEDVPDNCIVLGNPARVVKKIDFEDQ
jgi:acetyltransferase-like isoleucine patch superfamily enzyme